MSFTPKKPPLGLRFLLQLATFVVCIVLIASLFVTSVLVDLHLLTSSGGIKAILTGLMNSTTTSQSSPPAVGTLGVARLQDSTDGLPADVATAEGNALADYLYSIVGEYFGEDVPITQEQMQTFINESTVTDYLSEKIADIADDVLNGTQNTVITTEEIMQLVEENQQLVEETFNIVITDEMKQELETQVAQAVEGEEGINQTIHAELQKAMEQPVSLPVPGLENASMADLMATLNRVIQLPVLLTALAIVLILVAAVLLLNYYNMAAGLRKVAISVLAISIPLAVPVILLQFATGALLSIIPDVAVLQTAAGVVGAIAPMHYGLLIGGVVLLVGSIVWSCLARRKAA